MVTIVKSATVQAGEKWCGNLEAREDQSGNDEKGKLL